jgi:hypothetical protein
MSENIVKVKRSPDCMHESCAIDFTIGPLHFYLSEKEALDLRDQITAVSERQRCKECGSEPCFCNDRVYDGWTRKQLKDAFDKVCDPKDWKAPIYARVMRKNIDVTLAAIAFFTGTSGGVRDIAGRPDVYIESEGYRKGPAGDH